MPARGIERCSNPACLVDLRETASAEIGDDLRFGIGLCADLLSPFAAKKQVALNRLHPSLRQCDTGVLFELGWSLGCLDETDFATALSNPKRVRAEDHAAILARGGRLLARAPDCINDLISSRLLDSTNGESLDLLCRRLRALENRLSWIKLPGLREIFADIVPRGHRRHGPRAFFENCGYVTALHICEQTPIARRSLLKLERAGLITPQCGGTVQLRRLYPSSLIDRLRKIKSNRISAESIARILNIGTHDVFGLLEEQLLAIEADPMVNCLWTGVQVSKPSADSLIRAVEGVLQRRRKPTKSVTLQIAWREYGGSTKPWAHLIRAILQREIVLFAPTGTNLRGAKIATRDIPKLLHLPVCKARQFDVGRATWIKQADACELLNCGIKQLLDLVSAGVLNSSGNRRGSTYRLSDVDELARKLIHPTEIRALLKKGTRSKATHALRQNGLLPVAGDFYPRAQALSILQASGN